MAEADDLTAITQENRGGGENRSNNDRKPFDKDRKPYQERKQFSGKQEFSNPRTPAPANQTNPTKQHEGVRNEVAKTEGATGDKPARKRTNKLTDYLEKPGDGKPSNKKKSESSEVDEFLKKYDDDLSW